MSLLCSKGTPAMAQNSRLRLISVIDVEQYGFESISNINITLVWRTCDWHVRGISTWFEHGWMNNFLVVLPGVWFKADGQLTFLYDNEGPWHYFENFDVDDRDKIEKVIKNSVQFNKGKRPALVADAIAGRSD
ncbi:hypothetical protein HBI56_192380 [Parastagonospora nodorum]|uniref:Uncharacterized protein n=2 Tax=Phaeosphaeria nodorum (strain SN15 / ATCC MYA-4574 / FGSC 10173) TaxID=321614 RepID=A0A7U2IA89_PHANO|nr:hypothetical protein SNOG_14685 [Parastagonospora nodorum SN15]KAH3908121.1 hypothetical protein HBH56_177950 [Parastagonospora nodorum]EAT77877.1 hypothetical protein SNOG_14685 [Parastagonospora nodorum SN15]KAH3931973.1 hypothetical protein HBH54_091860 [Parastagonospora nodorum]KAH3939626.1 hypothetical protein HBH53_232560 [Parastagonospora nodorum]KAH3957539.1 hypothetical protein HBH51_224510 [Parastagonospora nodorum]